MIYTTNYLNEEITRTEEYITTLNTGTNETFLLDLLMSNGQTGKALAESISWKTELNPELEAGMLDGVMEGAEYGEAGEPAQRALLHNNCQIIKQVASISGTAMALDPHGIDNHLQKDVNEKLILCKRALNKAILEGTIQNENVATGKARKMNGLINMIAVTEDLEGAKLAPEHIESAMERMWKEGNGGNKLCLVNATAKKKINAMYKEAQEVQLQVQAGANHFGVLATVVYTDFGTVFFILDRNMPADQIVLFDPAQLVLETLRPFEIKSPETGADSIKRVIIGEYTLKVRNQHAHAKILNFI